MSDDSILYDVLPSPEPGDVPAANDDDLLSYFDASGSGDDASDGSMEGDSEVDAPVGSTEGEPDMESGLGTFTVFSPDGETVISGEGFPVINTNVLEVDYDAVYDSVFNASYDAIEAYSQSVTDGQQVNATALSYFQGILENRFLPLDYVIYVGDSYRYNNTTYYEYCMAYGDLDVSGTHISGTGTVVTMRLNGNRSVWYAYDQPISLDAPLYYSRSNLGDYSGIVSYDWTGLLMLVSFWIGGLTWLIKKLLRVSY